ncbi:MAG: histidine phosphatase family protein [Rhodovibrionaceae bacterium]
MHLVRHGQSWFNVHFGKTRVDPGIVDPGLTEEGQAQAQAAGEALRGKGLVKLLVSPYLRTLETAEIIASTLELPIVINPLVRERCFFMCDIGTARGDLVPASRLRHAGAALVARAERDRGGTGPALPRFHSSDARGGRVAPDLRRHPLGLHPRADRLRSAQRRNRAARPGRRSRQRAVVKPRQPC